jgi:PAS domain-containing protein
VEGASGLGARSGEYGLVLAAPRRPADRDEDPGPASVPLLVRRPQRRHPHARLLLAPLAPRPEVSDATSPLFALAADGSVCGANRRFVEVVGRTHREVIGSNVSALLGRVSPGRSDPIARSLADGKARTQEVEYARLPRFHQVTIRPLSRTSDGIGALLVRLEGAAG